MDKKVTKEINKNLKLDARNFLPSQLYYGIISDGLVPLFVHVDFGVDRERRYSENNYGVLHYETINSSFMVFKAYLDILEKIILNQCDKYLLPALLTSENDRSCRRSTVCSHSSFFNMKKITIRRKPLFFAVKLIKLLSVQSSQVVNPRFIRECYNIIYGNIIIIDTSQ